MFDLKVCPRNLVFCFVKIAPGKAFDVDKTLREIKHKFRRTVGKQDFQHQNTMMVSSHRHFLQLHVVFHSIQNMFRKCLELSFMFSGKHSTAAVGLIKIMKIASNDDKVQRIYQCQKFLSLYYS